MGGEIWNWRYVISPAQWRGLITAFWDCTVVRLGRKFPSPYVDRPKFAFNHYEVYAAKVAKKEKEEASLLRASCLGCCSVDPRKFIRWWGLSSEACATAAKMGLEKFPPSQAC